MRRHYREMEFWDLHFPRELAKRGVDDREALPVYPFRDDGLRIWEALRSFVGEYVEHYYPDAESYPERCMPTRPRFATRPWPTTCPEASLRSPKRA